MTLKLMTIMIFNIVRLSVIHNNDSLQARIKNCCNENCHLLAKRQLLSTTVGRQQQ